MATLFVFTLSAAALRFHSLGAKTFWFDEGVSVAIARLDGYNFFRILWRREANMSLYYALLHSWLWLGASEFFIRSLSVLFGVASIPAIYALGRRLFNSQTGLIAAALLTVNAFHVGYSQEARSYSLMMLLCILSSLYFVETLEKPSSRSRAAYIIFSALAVYAHFYSLLLLVAQWLSLHYLKFPLSVGQPAAAWKKTWKILAICIAPVLLFVATTGAGPLRWIPRPGVKDLWNFGLLLSGHDGLVLLLLCAFLALFGAAPALRKSFADAPWTIQFLLLWLAFPILFVLALSIFRPLFLPRYFIFCLPALLLLMAAGLGRIRSPWLRAPLLILCLALSLRGTCNYYSRDFDNERDDWRSASQYVMQHTQPGDALLFHVPMGRMPYEYYLSLNKRPTVPAVLYPYHGPHITFLDFVEKPDYARISRELPQYRRVWVVTSHAETPTGLDRVATLLTSLASTNRSPMQHITFNGIDVFLYQ
jgi:mannosyltransferase